MIIEPTCAELTYEFYSMLVLHLLPPSEDDQRAISFRLGGIARHLSITDFGVALDLSIGDLVVSIEHPFLPR